MSPSSDPLERLRAIIAAWPETREKLSHGAPTWWGGRKTFATFAWWRLSASFAYTNFAD